MEERDTNEAKDKNGAEKNRVQIYSISFSSTL